MDLIIRDCGVSGIDVSFLVQKEERNKGNPVRFFDILSLSKIGVLALEFSYRVYGHSFPGFGPSDIYMFTVNRASSKAATLFLIK